MLELLLIGCIIVFITDISGIVDYIHKFIWSWLYPNITYKSTWRIKILSCSLCQTFWIGIIYLLIMGIFNLPMLAFVCLIAYFTPVIQEILFLIKDLMIRILSKI